jgi:valyl-tRNA synthetase
MLSITTPSIMIARYPESSDYSVDQDSVHTITWIKNIITGLRNMRGEMNVPPRKPIELLIKNASHEDKITWQAQESLLKELGFIEKITWLEKDAAIPACASVIVGQLEILVPLSGIINPQDEINRLEKLLVKTQKEHDKLSQKLHNPHYCANMTADVLAQEKHRLTELAHIVEKTKMQQEHFKLSQ